MKRKLLLLVFVFFVAQFSQAQYVGSEIGAQIGAYSFQSDYGERGDFKSTIGKIGFNAGIVHFLDFSYGSRSYFLSHFKIKNELSYSVVNFEHFGKYAAGQSINAERLRNMKGSTKILNVGIELVWYPMDIDDFNHASEGAFAPFASLGFQYNYYTPEVKSDLGPVDDPQVLPTKFYKGVTNESGSTGSVVAGIGVRYKLSDYVDLILEGRTKIFFSDWVDGVNPDKKVYKENKYNDFSVGMQLGVVYKLN